MKLKKLLAASVAAVAGFSLLIPLAACSDDDGYVDNTGEELTTVESSEAAEKLSEAISTMQNSTNASLTISMTYSGTTMSYDVKLVKTDSHLYADETISRGEQNVKSYIRDGVFYYYNKSSGSDGRYSYDEGTGWMIYDTVDNMYYNFWSADLDELCTEEILRAYFTDSSYEWYVEYYGADYVNSMFKNTVIYNNTIYSARLWTLRNFGSYNEVMKSFCEVMEAYGENISAKASEHRYEATFNYGSITYSISLTDGAALRSSDFASLDSLIDDEICYISQSSASSLSALKNGGSATIKVEGDGYLGSDNGKYGSISYDMDASYLYAKYNGIIVPVNIPDEYDSMTYTMIGSEYAKYSNVTGYLIPSKSLYTFGGFASTTLNDVNNGESKSFDFYIVDYIFDEFAYYAASWLDMCGVVDYDNVDDSLLSLSGADICFSYFYSETEQTDDGYYNKMIRFYTYVSCDF